MSIAEGQMSTIGHADHMCEVRPPYTHVHFLTIMGTDETVQMR
jgi:hypothetical protein